MITSKRLYLVPILFSPLLIIPVVGWLIYIIIFSFWLFRNAGDIVLNVQDIKYKPGEYSRKDKMAEAYDKLDESINTLKTHNYGNVEDLV